MSVPEIDVDDLAKAREAGAAILDVRQPQEYEEVHAAGARLIPLGELVERTDEVPREGTVYVICGSGGRSARAVQHLLSIGVDAVNVAGGTKAWEAAGFPTASGPEPG